jgi:integrase
VTFDALFGLAYPADSLSRANWSAAHLADIARFEGSSLTVTGYLSHAIRVEGKEYCNSEAGDEDLVFRGNDGGELRHNFDRAWRAAREAVRLPWLRVHDLRHEAASRFL